MKPKKHDRMISMIRRRLHPVQDIAIEYESNLPQSSRRVPAMGDRNDPGIHQVGFIPFIERYSSVANFVIPAWGIRGMMAAYSQLGPEGA